MKLGQLWLLGLALATGMPTTTQAIRFTKKAKNSDASASVPLNPMPDEAAAPMTDVMAEAALDTTVTPRTPVTEEDKNDALQAFQEATDFVREVIEEGEPNETDRHELLDLLETQKTTFDTNVTNSKSVGDPSYCQYMQQKNRLDALVAAQQQADSLLEEHSAITPLAERTVQQLRALILYELNAKLSVMLTPADEPTSLDNSVITAIVTRSVELVKSGLPENEFLRQQCDLMQQQLDEIRESAAETAEHESAKE